MYVISSQSQDGGRVGVAVGTGVEVGGIGVEVGGIGVTVGGRGVEVGRMGVGVAVGGTKVGVIGHIQFEASGQFGLTHK